MKKKKKKIHANPICIDEPTEKCHVQETCVIEILTRINGSDTVAPSRESSSRSTLV